MTKHILVVDDDLLLVESIHRRLEASGYTVTAATSGDDAVAFLEQNRCDLLLCDIHMEGGQDGFAVLAACKTMHPATKVILCSGDIAYRTISLAFKCGADGFLSKPFTPNDLLDQVNLFMEEPRKSPQSIMQRPPAPKDADLARYLC